MKKQPHVSKHVPKRTSNSRLVVAKPVQQVVLCQSAADIVTDVQQMTVEGYAQTDIVQYLKRTYSLG
jgi:hypothetical protein